MEEEREEQGERAQSGTISTQADTLIENCNEENGELHNLKTAEEEVEVDSAVCDGETDPNEVGEDQYNNDTENIPQETLTDTNTQDDAECLPLCLLPTEEELTPTTVLSHPSNTQNHPSEPCWYCLRSLDSEYRPETPKQSEDSDPSTAPPSGGNKVNYQTDPRPHFGVAWSSHSTCRPLWGSEGPCWGQRNQELPDQTHTCPHCHLGLPADTLRWHEAKCLLFDGLRSTKK
ncbi:uncharacterized protein LOC117813206 [Notolabrus celidotus]|uniref:uncharacterized protein LOC117813206 n=1 Tax=Notolabrus celidotus TaxID=1203425 RepID=UPI00149077CE|nr:uncharacterized protein LOC117813206 [Notolabrus celidotus]